MSKNSQFVISINRVMLPESLINKRVVLSVVDKKLQHFTQKPKIAKTNKLNFYRENLYLSDLTQGLVFHIYQIDEQSHKTILQTFRYDAQQFISLTKRAALFHTTKDRFELVWQISQRQTDEDADNEETDRDYTELNAPILGHNNFSVHQLSVISRVHQNKTYGMGKKKLFTKRSNSTKQSLSQISQKQKKYQKQLSAEKIKSRTSQISTELSRKVPLKQKCKVQSQILIGKEKQKKSTLKSVVCQNLLKQISTLFSIDMFN